MYLFSTLKKMCISTKSFIDWKSNVSIFLVSLIFSAGVYANPVLDNVAAGNVSVQQSPNSTVINQSSSQAIINWQSFNIGKQESTHFQQPVGGMTLNRISPTDGASQIYGRLTATGQIILMNPAGIFFGPSSYVNVGSLIATTNNLTNANFLKGNYQFSKVLGYNGSIVNEGQLIAATHGLIALVGSGVSNSGLIKANLGHVVLASGDAFTMNFQGNDMINFSITKPTSSAGVDKNGKPLTSAVSNTGKLIANGGEVLVTAQAAQGILDNVINMGGIVEAKSVGQRNGEIIISGDNNAGVVTVSAKMNASGKKANQTGGTVDITGYDIALASPTLIDVSGAAGGGNINIGGNAHGAGSLPDSNTVIMAPGATLLASAINNGNGGNVVLWSNNVTQAYGDIIAQGGALGGNGGNVETSSANYLDVNGLNVNLLAANGKTGNWLLDPADLTICTDCTTSSSLSSGTYTPNSTSLSTSYLLNTDLEAQLNTANITIETSGSVAGTGTGSINVDAPITWGNTNTLTLSAFNSINVNAPITATGGGSMVLTTNNNIGGTSSGSGTLNFNGGNIQFTGTLGAGGSALTINGANYILVNTQSAFENIDGTDNYALASNVNASSWSNFISVDGIGTGLNFNGLGNTISNLIVNGIGGNGLFVVNQGTISNIGLVQLQGTATEPVGGGFGGLVGENVGIISNAYVTGSVSDPNAETQYVGLLVGFNAGDAFISNSYSSGTVSGTSGGASVFAGGLVGNNALGSTITNSYSSARVTTDGSSNNATGGLVGFNDNTSTISNSYATGAVTGGNAGGLVGNNSGGTLSNAYWNSSVMGTGVGTGSSAGASGLTTSQLTSNLPSGFSSSVWANVNNQSSPYLVGVDNINSVLLPSSSSTLYTVLVNTAQLQAVNNNLSGNYILANVIDATGYNFTSLGNFTGIFNGLSNSISNLTINSSASNTGLFSSIGSGGLVENLGLNNDSIISTGSFVGGIAGSNAGTILNTFANGSVTGGNFDVGGLVGQNNGSISSSYAGGTVIGMNQVGGLVGINSGSGSAISNSYSTASVSGSSQVGGLAGESDGTSTISDAYSSGKVTGSGSNVGGFVGFNQGSISNSFWDKDTSGQPSAGVGSGSSSSSGLTGETTADMMNISTFASWSITSVASTSSTIPSAIWFIFSSDGITRPMLLSEWSTQVTNAHQLQLAGAVLGASYTLINNIDLSSAMTNASDVWGTNTNTSTGTGFVPIGNSSAFSGSFNGQNFIINNLFMNAGPAANAAGLFGEIQTNGIIQNIGLTNANVSGGGDVGILAGFLDSGTIQNVFSTGQAEGTSSFIGGGVGGLIGALGSNSTATPATLNNAYSLATATSTGQNGSAVGGLIGTLAPNGSASNVYSEGFVSQIGTTSAVLGGLVGSSSGGSVTNGYWDNQTAGPTSSAAGTGMSTTALQSALPSGFTSGWSILPGQSFPYLTNFFPSTPRVISGTAPAGTTGGTSISFATNGNIVDTVGTGANQFFYLFTANGAIADNVPVLAFLNSGSVLGNTLAITQSGGASSTDLSLTANTLTIGDNTLSSSLSNSTLVTAIGSLNNSNILYTVAGNNITLANGNSIDLTLPTSFNLNGNITTTNGSQTYSGPVTASSGSLSLIANTAGNINLNSLIDNATGLTITSAGTNVITDLAGTGALSVNGGGSFTINNNNTYTGAINLSDATALTLNMNLTGSGAINQNGVGSTLDITGSNSNYSGVITLTNGTLQIGNDNLDPLGTGALNLNGGTLLVSDSITTNPLVNNITIGTGANTTISAAQSINFTPASGNAFTFADSTGVLNFTHSGGTDITMTIGGTGISGAGAITQAIGSTGTMIIGSTNTNNTYTGAYTLTNGTLQIATTNADPLGTGTLALNGGTLDETALPGAIANNVTVGTNANVTLTGPFGLNFTGSTFALNSGSTLNITNGGGTITFNNNLSGSGAISVNNPNGTFALAGSNSGYSGAITLTTGTLQIANDNLDPLGTGSLTLNGGTLTASTNVATNPLANTVSIGANQTVDLNTGSNNLTFANPLSFGNNSTIINFSNGGTTTFNGLTGSGAYFTGPNTTVVNGSNSGYSGTINLAQGILQIGNDNLDPLGTGTLNLEGGTLAATTAVTTNPLVNSVSVSGGTSTINGADSITFASGISLSNDLNIGNTAGTISFTNNLTGTGAIAQNGSGGSLSFSGSNSGYSGAITLTNGTLQIANDNLDPLGTGTLALNGGTVTTTTAVVTHPLANNISIGNGATTTINNGSKSISLSGTLAFGNSSSTLDVTNTSTLSLNGNLSGSGAIIQNGGGGTLTLSGSNSAYSGAITINSGTLQAGNDNLDPLGTGTLNLNTSSLRATQSEVTNPIVNSINIGTSLILDGNSNTTFSGPIVFTTSGAALNIFNPTNLVLNGNLSGTGSISINNTGNLSLAGTNSYTGSTTVGGGGSLTVLSSSGLGGPANHTSGVTVSSGASLKLNSITLATNIPLTLNGSGVGGIGALVGMGGGTSVWGGNITLGSNTTIATSTAADKLSINNQIDGADTLTLSGPGSIQLNGAVGSNTNLASLISNAATTFLAAGTITTTGSQTYNNAVKISTNTTINASSLSFGSTVNSTSVAENLTANTGTGSISFTGNVGSTIGLGAMILNNTSSTTFSGTVNASSLTSGTGSTIINGGSIITSGAQDYQGVVTLGADTNLSTTNNNITFGSTIDSSSSTARALTLSAGTGAISLGGVIGGTHALSTFTASDSGASNSITVANNINTTSNINITAGDNVTLSNGSLLSGGNASLTGSAGLVQETGTGIISGSLLTTNSVGGTTLNNTNTVTSFNASNSGSGNIVLKNSGALTITGANQTAATGAVNVTNTGALTTSGTIAAAGGAINLSTLGSSSLLTIGSNINTTGGPINLNAANSSGTAIELVLNSGSILSTGTGSGGTLTLGGGINLSSGTIDVGAGGITLQGNGNNLFIQGAFNSPIAFDVAGTITVTGNITTTNNPISFNSPTIISNAATINAGTAAITFDNTLALNAATILDGTVITLENALSGTQNLSITGTNATATANTLSLSTGGTQNWLISSANGGSISGLSGYTGDLTFSNMGNLTGGGNDNFNFTAGSIAGNLTGNGSDTLSYLTRSGSVNVNLQTATATGIGGTFSGINSFVGNNSSSTLSDTAGGSTWSFATTGNTIAGNSFSGFNALTGGNGDTFSFGTGATAFAGTISATNGILNESANSGALTVNLANSSASNINGGAANGFSGFTNFTGNSASTLSDTTGSNTWAINTTNSTVSGNTFNAFGNLIGGNGDTFNFGSGVSFAGTLTASNATLNESNYGSALTVNLANSSASNINGGAANGFSGFTNFTGNSASTLSDTTGSNTWAINTTNSTVSGNTFNGFGNLTGGNGDTFNFGSGVSFAGTLTASNATLNESNYGSALTVNLVNSSASNINGGAANGFSGFDNFLGNSASTISDMAGSNAWLINPGNNTVAGNIFTGFGNLMGGNGDSFSFGTGASISGTITASNATLNEVNSSDAITINLVNSSATNIDSGAANGFSGFNNFVGNSASTLSDTAGSNTWAMSTFNSTVAGNTFNVFGHLIGGNGDTFTFANGASFAGTLTASNATLNESNYGNTLTVNLANASATNVNSGAANGLIGFSNFIGTDAVSGSNSTLVGANNVNTWTINALNQGNVGGNTFSGFGNLTGGTSSNDFVFNNGMRISGSLTGGAGGNNILDISAYTTPTNVILTGATQYGSSGTTSGAVNPVNGFSNVTQINNTATGTNSLTAANTNNTWTINSNGGSVNNGLSTLAYNNFENLIGGAGNDTFTVNSGTLSGSINGGAGNNTLSAQQGNNTWQITSANSGIVTALNNGFSNIQNLSGGAGSNNFIFAANGTISGNLTSGGNATLDLSSKITAPVSVNLQSGTATAIGGVFSGINNFIGTDNATGNNSTLIGSNNNNTWSINATNKGSVGTVSFSNFGNLTGGTSNNTFVFANQTKLTGLLNGGSLNANNDIVYTSYTNALSVQLSSLYQGTVSTANNAIITNFMNINHSNFNGGVSNTLNVPAGKDTIVFTAAQSGFVNDPFFFTGISNFIAAPGSGSTATFTGPFTFNPVTNTYTYQGSTLSLTNITVNSDGDDLVLPVSISSIITQGNGSVQSPDPLIQYANTVDQNINDLVSQTAEDFDTNLSSIKINPFCSQAY